MKEVDAYFDALPADRKDAMNKLREVMRKNIPSGFTEVMAYGMPTWVVPHKYYPAGYHCDPKLPLPFVSFASKKNFIAMYHMGIYAQPELLQWFTEAYPRFSKTKLDMGKSCIRFKKPETIPLALIGELMQKMTPDQWIAVYEKNFTR